MRLPIPSHRLTDVDQFLRTVGHAALHVMLPDAMMLSNLDLDCRVGTFAERKPIGAYRRARAAETSIKSLIVPDAPSTDRLRSFSSSSRARVSLSSGSGFLGMERRTIMIVPY